MKKIVTAMGSNRLAEEIRRTNSFDVVSRDIPYKEGILELLEEMPDVNIIVLSEILDGEIEFQELIRRILQINESIEIIVFVEEKTSEIQNFLFSNGIYKIYQNNEIDLETFINTMIESNVPRIAETEYKHTEKSALPENDMTEFEEFNAIGKVISITGPYNSGKSTIACMLGKEYAKQGQKTLIIDFDTYNSSIHLLLNINKYKQEGKSFSIENQITKVGKNLYAFCGADLLFNENNPVDYVNLEDMIRNFKINYDIILIDTTSYFKYKYLKRILNASDGIVYLIVPSVVELTKSANLLEVFLQDFNVDKNKFQIVLNKVSKFSLDKMMLSQMFRQIKITTSTQYDPEIEKKVINGRETNLVKINEE